MSSHILTLRQINRVNRKLIHLLPKPLQLRKSLYRNRARPCHKFQHFSKLSLIQTFQLLPKPLHYLMLLLLFRVLSFIKRVGSPVIYIDLLRARHQYCKFTRVKRIQQVLRDNTANALEEHLSGFLRFSKRVVLQVKLAVLFKI